MKCYLFPHRLPRQFVLPALSTVLHNQGTGRVQKPQSFFHLHLISDATGETLLAAGRAAAAQYKNARAIEHIYPLIRTEKQLARVFEEIDRQPGIVLYTIVDQALARQIDERCQTMGLPVVSVLEPVLGVFQSYLGTPAGRRVGAQHVLDAGYFQRIDALNFTMEHDDGQLPHDVEEADVVLVGVSRTSKTPTSIYLANRGVKTANVPIVLDVPPPPALLTARHPLIVCLVASAERISLVRQNRVLGTHADDSFDIYTDRATIGRELSYARQLSTRHGWPLIDVTRRSIEETAAAIMALRAETRSSGEEDGF
ncbi:putative pyruvate, phosphate dikinase regulatory protein [Nitratireductor basaltis]|uniref:Putative pyruvate, phosphate dikinase regulatory protein n=1 Tax=Nitratireductor basaltis TaxID=472175 RepID=A0A084U6C6_9HYPH|nr:putative pyruvate, phosphate dikinase regulatory protein [Nitratireductor basaltis]